MQVSIETAIKNGEASLRMEGMRTPPEVLRDCKRVLDGEISHEQYIAVIREKYMETEQVAGQP